MKSNKLNSYKIWDYKKQKISKWMVGFYICEECHYIHVGHEMVDVGYRCDKCNLPSKGGMIFFKYNLTILIDLMQDLYNTEKSNDDYGRNKKRLSVVIFYTTIGEILIDQFLKNLIKKHFENKNLQDKLINDCQSMNKKKELYKLLTGKKFISDIGSLEQNFINIVKNYKKIRDARNDFLHNGYTNAITDKMPKQCLDDVMKSVILFVELNNKYNLINVNDKN